MPDALDMLVICAEAGLSSDARFSASPAETGRKSSASATSRPDLDRAGFIPERRLAFEKLRRGASMLSISAVVKTMIQTEKYGTPLARAPGAVPELRHERMMRAEEKAAGCRRS